MEYMEKRKPDTRRPDARKGRAEGGRPASGRIDSAIERLRESPIAYNVVAIVLILVAITAACSLLMMIITRHGTHRTVPDFTGITLDEAQVVAKDRGLNIIINDSLYVPAYDGGIVLDQLPLAGVEVKAGRKVYVTINSFRQKTVKVPYVAGRSLRQAKNMLEVAGLGIEKLVYVEDIATNYVLAEFVDGKEVSHGSSIEIEMGSGVTLRVGMEPDKRTTIVPKAIGQSLQSAKSRLWEEGLNVGKVTFDDGIDLLNEKDARVYRQSVSHNATASLGAAIDLWLTLDEKEVEKNSAASDKAAKKLAEERMQQEQERQDSLEQAERNDVVRALQQSSAMQDEVTETDEDEFF